MKNSREWYSKSGKCICGAPTQNGETYCNNCKPILKKIDRKRRANNEKQKI